MSQIRAFRGIRPNPEFVERVQSPQYDTLDSDEARLEAADNPYAFLHVTKPEIDLPLEIDVHDDEVYRQGTRAFHDFLLDGILLQDAQPSLYVYRLTMGEHVQFGLVAETSVAEYDSGAIRRHELTRAEKEDDRTRHIDALNANTGPVLLTYRARPEIDRLIDAVVAGEPLYRFTAAYDIEHALWRVADEPTIAALRTAFASVERLYVADGHHRSASASRIAAARRAANPNHRGDEPYNYFLSVLFPDDQLKIFGYYRVVSDLGGLDRERFIARLCEHFELAGCEDGLPQAPHEITMRLDYRWYRLTPRAGTVDWDDPVASLDVSILQRQVLGPILGIGDPRTDPRIDFVGGIRGVRELERRVHRGAAVAFALFPTSVAELLRIADRDEIMPPKSTWFEPKLRAGLIARSLHEGDVLETLGAPERRTDGRKPQP
ncbi:MAG: DUF1015 domain-containing protein [Myxococcales bacterium]|nr:DUF1015 domain-containing protein [Myxococcales bacterium]